MIISLNSNWRLVSDPLQWILQRRRPSGKKWDAEGFFTDLDRAVIEAARRQIRLERTTVEADALPTLCRFLTRLESEIKTALKGISVKAEDHHHRAA